LALAVLDADVDENGSLIKCDATMMLLFCQRYLVLIEKVPGIAVDDFVWRPAQDVYDGV
jgi:hypothetical protein